MNSTKLTLNGIDTTFVSAMFLEFNVETAILTFTWKTQIIQKVPQIIRSDVPLI